MFLVLEYSLLQEYVRSCWTLKAPLHQATSSQMLRWQAKWVCNLSCPSHWTSKRSKVLPVNVTVMMTESLGVNRPKFSSAPSDSVSKSENFLGCLAFSSFIIFTFLWSFRPSLPPPLGVNRPLVVMSAIDNNSLISYIRYWKHKKEQHILSFVLQ